MTCSEHDVSRFVAVAVAVNNVWSKLVMFGRNSIVIVLIEQQQQQ